jgi:hypothetical protein
MVNRIILHEDYTEGENSCQRRSTSPVWISSKETVNPPAQPMDPMFRGEFHNRW